MCLKRDAVIDVDKYKGTYYYILGFVGRRSALGFGLGFLKARFYAVPARTDC